MIAYAASDLLIVPSAEVPFYADIIASLRTAMAGEPTSIRVVPVDELDAALALRSHPPGLIVTLGSYAATVHHELPPGAPVIHALIPEHTFRNLPTPLRSPPIETALFLDQPLSRHMQLIRTALPYARRVGVLIGDRGALGVDALEQGAAEAGLVLVVERVASKGRLITQLDRLLARIDVLLVTTDAELYNRHTLKRILLTSYRQRVPLVGLSTGYVKAGALLAVHTTAAQFARELATMVQAALTTADTSLPEARHPSRYTIDVNRQVAHSLSLNLPDVRQLEQALATAERTAP